MTEERGNVIGKLPSHLRQYSLPYTQKVDLTCDMTSWPESLSVRSEKSSRGDTILGWGISTYHLPPKNEAAWRLLALDLILG